MSDVITHPEYQYLMLLRNIMNNGVDRGDRTGTGTRSLFAQQMRFDIENGKEFPLFTTKSTHWKSIAHELLWFISGSTNVKYLQDNGVTIWNEWADENGDLGPVYGSQWRNWTDYDFQGCDDEGYFIEEPDCSKTFRGAILNVKAIDQLAQVINTIRTNPEDRRIIISAWNVAEIPRMKLPPCHAFFQFYVAGNDLSVHLYQRSCDMFLGVPFNVASYALLLQMVAQVTGKNAKEMVWTGGDCHIYHNHFDQVMTQLDREPLDFPQLTLNPDIKEIDDFKFDDLTIENYVHHERISAPIAV